MPQTPCRFKNGRDFILFNGFVQFTPLFNHILVSCFVLHLLYVVCAWSKVYRLKTNKQTNKQKTKQNRTPRVVTFYRRCVLNFKEKACFSISVRGYLAWISAKFRNIGLFEAVSWMWEREREREKKVAPPLYFKNPDNISVP